MSECDICDYAAEHGWWGPLARSGTHCSVCHRTWTSRSQAHCTVCHEQFASNGVADSHWRKTGHTHPSEIEAFWGDESGVWHYGARFDVQSIHRGREAVLRGDLEATP